VQVCVGAARTLHANADAEKGLSRTDVAGQGVGVAQVAERLESRTKGADAWEEQFLDTPGSESMFGVVQSGTRTHVGIVNVLNLFYPFVLEAEALDGVDERAHVAGAIVENIPALPVRPDASQIGGGTHSMGRRGESKSVKSGNQQIGRLSFFPP
jgi:hypothetical protein